MNSPSQHEGFPEDQETAALPADDESKEQIHSNGDLAQPSSSAPATTAAVSLSKALSTTSDVPDGGSQAWLQVLSGFCIFFNTWGLIASFGVFQTYYESGAIFHASSSDIAWIGSLQAFFTFAAGWFVGPIFDRGYLNFFLLAGSFGVVFGFMMTSICKELWQCILAQGICVGLGAGMLFVPVTPTLAQYWQRHLALANGISASGAAIGGIVYPIAFHRLLSEVGFGWGVRILGFIALATLIPPILFLKRRFKPAKPRDFIDYTAFRDPPWCMFAAGAVLSVIGLYSILFYLSYFSNQQGIADADLSFYILPIYNAASFFGRIVPNLLADMFGPFNVLAPANLICAILIFCMIAVSQLAGLIVVAVLFGLSSGVLISLPGVCYVQLTKDRSRIGTRMGMGIGFIGVGALAGGPGSGSVLQDYSASPDWTLLWLYGGIAATVASALFFAVRFWMAGGKLWVKV